MGNLAGQPRDNDPFPVDDDVTVAVLAFGVWPNKAIVFSVFGDNLAEISQGLALRDAPGCWVSVP